MPARVMILCDSAAILRYWKYCRLMCSGCSGEKPWDGLDACCMKHDACVQAKNSDYLSRKCCRKLFKGNTCDVSEFLDVLSVMMEAELVEGRYLYRP
ncbi:hypothetical protein MLD38_005946 [Melastoma candidum]|uniref:Uncharacterized protein n=1 Tax=Melastoma candidum TaxID=119954 RepID=A0ACB9RKR3_9MYRT|nr:hypothetical protein MLD38_005946 [Melastoma candidum]